MKSKTESAAQTSRDLLNDLRSLVAEAEKTMSDSLTEHSEDAIGALRSRFNAAQERFSEIYEGARDRVVAGARCTDATIRANPYQTLAIVAGVAILVGVLVGRRTR